MRSPLPVRPSVPAHTGLNPTLRTPAPAVTPPPRACCPACRRPLGGRPKLARPVPVLTLEQLRDVAGVSGRLLAVEPPVIDVGDNAQVRATVAVVVERVGRVIGEAVLDEDFLRTDDWRGDPLGTLCGLAEARALRAAFPGTLGDSRTPWEVAEEAPEISRTGPLVARGGGVVSRGRRGGRAA